MGEVQTVRGRVAAAEIGFTLPHEHTRCVLWHIPNRWDYWQLTGEEDLIAGELGLFRDAGGSCVVDVTLQSIGRDAARLRRLSEATGLHLVMGCGWYRQAYYPAEARIGRRTVDDLAAELVREFHEGADGTDVRPGIIGEIGTDKPWMSGEEERVHRAAARAARATGMAVTTHAVMSGVGLAQLRVFDEEGLDPGRVVVGHADSNPSLDHYLGIIARGANLEFDFLGMSFTPVERHGEPRLIRLLLELLGRGHAERILLSQDVCHDSQLKAYEGNGYVYLSETFLPRLRASGVDEATIRTMTVENPRRILTLAAAG
ncbi:MAG: phosphotriesterase, phosphotriesterase-related protein [Chloroflexi bacterium CSP1-4]|nr:MAG: phosphotriesterase, phosphotriesterase-related protein [Chloroflexi bacterium CSP1-4]